jgi:hypothetical protein
MLTATYGDVSGVAGEASTGGSGKAKGEGSSSHRGERVRRKTRLASSEVDAEKALSRLTVQAELEELKARVWLLERSAIFPPPKCRMKSETDDGSEVNDESEINDESESAAGSVESDH